MDTINQINAYTPTEMIINMMVALALGIIIAMVFKSTHKGLAYSQSFTITIVFITLIVAIVIMVIGSSLARAFALVGALSIIRFRTVVKDTKDTSYVFAGLAVGMAAGTSNYFLAGSATVVISLLAIILHKTNFGALYKSEFILRFNFDQTQNSTTYLEIIGKFSKRSNMLHVESAPDGRHLQLAYDIVLNEGATAQELIEEFSQIEGASEIILIASKNDVDY